VLISQTLAKALNQQIGNELGASLQYVSIGAFFYQRQLTLLSKLFMKQADEEREHAMKFASAEAAVEAALSWEHEVTRQITALMEIAVKENDYMAQSFLQWFIDEQLEEVVKMDRLLGVIKQSGERNLLMVEAYLVHIEKASD
jgi:ferritin